MYIFFDKEKIVLHYENLQLFLKLGLKLKKNAWHLQFNQPKRLKQYNELNTEKRLEAKKETMIKKHCAN